MRLLFEELQLRHIRTESLQVDVCAGVPLADSVDPGETLFVCGVVEVLRIVDACICSCQGKLNFFSQDEQYEIIYIGEEQEALINHVMESIPSHGSKRLIVLESESQAAKITIDDVAAYCLVNESGAVSYYMRK